MLHDKAVGHVRPAVDAHSRHVRVSCRKLESLVCHEDGRELEALRSAEADLLHRLWGSVSVDPERHGHEVSPMAVIVMIYRTPRFRSTRAYIHMDHRLRQFVLQEKRDSCTVTPS